MINQRYYYSSWSVKVLVLLLFVLGTGNAFGEPKVNFAGFAYLGKAENAAERYPHTVSLVPMNDGTSPIEAKLRETVGAIDPSEYTLVTDRLSDFGAGESLSVAFALNRETVDVEPICGDYKVVVDLAIQAIVFDFESMSIAGSYPLTLQYIDVLSERPSDAQKRAIIKDLYLGDRELDVFKKFADLLGDARIRRKYGNTIQVDKVVLGDKVQGALASKYADNPEALKSFVAEHFSTALASQHKISVLPYTKGYAVGNRMSARFANGEIYNFSMPTADYEAEIKLRGFKKVSYDQTSSGESFVYGSFIRLAVREPLSGTVYIDQRFKRGATKVVPQCQASSNDWPAFQESLIGLFDEIATQFVERDPEWLDVHAGDDAKLSDLKAMEKVIQRCR